MRLIPSTVAPAVLICLLGCSSTSPRTDVVKAKFFQKTGYDPKQLRMTVYFTDGSIYSYEKVPEKIYQQLIKSKAPGAFFNNSIRNDFSSQTIHARTAPKKTAPAAAKTGPAAPPFPCSEPAPANKAHVNSVTLDFAAYDAKNKCMTLYFDRGYIYQYGSVPPTVYSALVGATNVDKYFNQQIWGKYPKRQIKKP